MSVERGIRSNTAKAAFIAVVIIFAVCVYKFVYLDYVAKNEAKREVYRDYVKVEAMIVKIERTGRRGTGRMWTLEYRDAEGNVYKSRQISEGFMMKRKGESIYIYYDPTNPNEYVTDKGYNEVNN